MGYVRRRGFFLLLCTAVFFLGGIPLWSQQDGQNLQSFPMVRMDTGEVGDMTDPASLIGLTLEALYVQFGVPEAVYAVRGLEAWQDDVVFVYDRGDFYVYKNRVWQLGVKNAYGIALGEKRPAVSLLAGEDAQDFEDYILVALPSRGWPLMLRINFDGSTVTNATVSAIFIYRPDF